MVDLNIALLLFLSVYDGRDLENHIFASRRAAVNTRDRCYDDRCSIDPGQSVSNSRMGERDKQVGIYPGIRVTDNFRFI